MNASSFCIFLFLGNFCLFFLFLLGERDPGNCFSLNCPGRNHTTQPCYLCTYKTSKKTPKPIIFSQWDGFPSNLQESNTFPAIRFWRQSGPLNKKGDFVLKIGIALHLCKSIHLLSYASILMCRTQCNTPWQSRKEEHRKSSASNPVHNKVYY